MAVGTNSRDIKVPWDREARRSCLNRQNQSRGHTPRTRAARAKVLGQSQPRVPGVVRAGEQWTNGGERWEGVIDITGSYKCQVEPPGSS